MTIADLGRAVYVPVIFNAGSQPPFRVWKEARITRVEPIEIVFHVNGGTFLADPAVCEMAPPPEAVVL